MEIDLQTATARDRLEIYKIALDQLNAAAISGVSHLSSVKYPDHSEIMVLADKILAFVNKQ